MKRVKIIFSVCNKKKYGLRDISDALIFYGTKFDKNRIYKALGSFNELFQYCKQYSIKGSIAIVWDNSIKSLTLAIFFRIAGAHVIYYYHEPGGYRHKRQLRASITFSFLSVILEKLNKLIAKYTAISMLKNKQYGDFYLPILYEDSRPKSNSNAKVIGYLGKIKNERCVTQLESIREIAMLHGYSIKYFPSNEFGSDKEAKFNFLSNCAVIWNYYKYQYNMSAVTGDCIFSGTRIIINPYFEPEIDILNRCQLSINVLNEDLNDSKKLWEVISKNINSEPNHSELEIQKSILGGQNAFIENWLPVFRKIEHHE